MALGAETHPREQREYEAGCGILGAQLQNTNGPDGVGAPLPGPNHTHLVRKGGAAVHQDNWAHRTPGNTPVSSTEQQRRINVALSLLTNRPQTPRTIELAILALNGATADDFAALICPACRDAPLPGVFCVHCGLGAAR